MSLKFFSNTTVLLSGLMRFTSKRPTWSRGCTTPGTWINNHKTSIMDDLWMFYRRTSSITTQGVWLFRELLNIKNDQASLLWKARSKSLHQWFFFLIISFCEGYHIECCAPLFKFSLMILVQGIGSCLNLQPACLFTKWGPYIFMGVAFWSVFLLKSYSLSRL